MKKEVLLFDLDGTIIDSKNGIIDAVLYALKQYQIIETDPAVLNQYIGPPILDSLIRFHHFSLENAKKAVKIYREYYAQHGMNGNLLFDGVLPMLQSFYQKGKTLAIATSKPVEVAVPILDQLNLTDYFSFIGGSTLSGERPYKKDVIEYTLEQLQVSDKEKAVMIGDRCYDIIGAKAVGIDAVGVLYGYGSWEELLQEDCTMVVHTPEELENCIE